MFHYAIDFDTKWQADIAAYRDAERIIYQLCNRNLLQSFSVRSDSHYLHLEQDMRFSWEEDTKDF